MSQVSAVDVEVQRQLSQLRREEQAEKAADQRAQQMMKLRERELAIQESQFAAEAEMRQKQFDDQLEEQRLARAQQVSEAERQRTFEAEETDRFRNFLFERDKREGQTQQTLQAQQFQQQQAAMEQRATMMQEQQAREQQFQMALLKQQGVDAVRLKLATSAPKMMMNEMIAEMTAAQAASVRKEEALQRVLPQAFTNMTEEFVKLRTRERMVEEQFDVNAAAVTRRMPSTLAGIFVGLDPSDKNLFQKLLGTVPTDPNGRTIPLSSFMTRETGGAIRVDPGAFEKALLKYQNPDLADSIAEGSTTTFTPTGGVGLASTLQRAGELTGATDVAQAGPLTGTVTAKPIDEFDALRMTLSAYLMEYQNSFQNLENGQQTVDGMAQILEGLVTHMEEGGSTDQLKQMIQASGASAEVFQFLGSVGRGMDGVFREMRFEEGDRKVTSALRESMGVVKDLMAKMPVNMRQVDPGLQTADEAFDLIQQTLRQLSPEMSVQEMEQVIARLPSKEARDVAMNALRQPMQLRKQLDKELRKSKDLGKQVREFGSVFEQQFLQQQLGELQGELEAVQTGNDETLQILRDQG